jgi:hypothetical protein
MNRNERIHVQSTRGLVDESIHIRLKGFPSRSEVTLRATVSTLEDTELQSEATFMTDENGCVDVTTQRPLRGTYDEADGMGLFWSMTRMSSSDTQLVTNPLEPTVVRVTAEVGGE